MEIAAMSSARTSPWQPLYRWRWQLLAAIWVVVLTVGLLWSVDFDTRPAPAGEPVSAWPQSSPLDLASAGPTLVMFLHPECPCSQASLEELDRLLAHASPRPKTYLVFVGTDVIDVECTNVARAKKIAGAELCPGDGDAEARRFGSNTSGDLFVFNSSGQLAFEGGITAGRGHVGENLGAAAAAAAIEGRALGVSRGAVFGCPLLGPNG